MAEQLDNGNSSLSHSTASNYRSSSSSISVSGFSSSDTVDDTHSSSGCSLDMMQKMSRRKEKVKSYLKELKTMVNLDKPKGGRPDTLSTLEHVLNSMRKMKAKQLESDTDSRSRAGREDNDSGFHSSYHPPAEEIPTSSTESETLMFVLSPWDGVVETVSQNVKNMIGYSPEMLLGRPLSEFIRKQDQATYNKIISLDVDELDKWENVSADAKSSDDTKSKYFCIRTYKGLEQGYILGTADKYVPLEAKVSVKYLREGENPGTVSMKSVPSQTNVQPSMVSHGKRSCIVVICHPLKTVYIGPQCTPEHRTFSTKHNVQFLYKALHRSAIPLLGYLPQDFVGSSVFDYYHPDDLPELYHIYQTVVSGEEKVYKSKPYRLRVKNGDYILVETEWSALCSRWPREIEFIVGQHTVIRGPNNPNVFDSIQSHGKPEPSTSTRFILQEKIRKLLAKSTDVNSGDNLFTVPKTRDKKIDKPEKNLEKLPSEISDFSERRALSPTVSVPLSPSQDVYDVGGPSVTYEHLNYKTSIRRFLLSQPKTYSSENEKKFRGFLDEEDVEDEFIQATLVDFAIPKPPSFGSSTKVLVSEQEPREEIREDVPITSPMREEPAEDDLPVTSNEDSPISETEPPKYHPVTLTQEMLRAHTKRQEKLYVQQAAQEIHLSPTFGTACSKGQHRLKRLHSPQRDPEIDRLYRSAKTLRTDMLDKPSTDHVKPSFPVTHMDTSETDREQLRIFPCWPSYNTSTKKMLNLQQLQGNNLGLCTQGFPLMQLNPRSLSVPTTASSTHSNMQWPYYSTNAAAAYPFFPLYTPVSLFQTCSNPVYAQASADSNRPQHLSSLRRIAETRSSSSLSSQPKYERKKPVSMRKTHGTPAIQKKGNVWSESSDNMSSHEDTGSSLLYLLESDSHNCSSCPEEMDVSLRKYQHRLTDIPPWIQCTKWTDETMMRYTLPKRNNARTLKEDREKMAAMTTSNQPFQQLQELLEELGEGDASVAIDEEADDLIFLEKSDDENQSQVKLSEGFTIITLNDDGMCGRDKDHNHGLKSVFRSKKGKPKAKQETCEAMIEENQQDKQQDSSTSGNESGSPGKLSDTADVDSTTSKESSNLTPSDQRSNEEAPSSLKESDTSKEESDASSRDQKDCESDKETGINYPTLDFLEKIFTPLKLEVPQVCPFSKMSKLSHWVMDTTFNENIDKKYQLKVEPADKVLENDWKRSSEMKQSTEVKLQLGECQREILEDQQKKSHFLWGQQASSAPVKNMEANSSCHSKLRNVVITELMGAMLNPNQTKNEEEVKVEEEADIAVSSPTADKNEKCNTSQSVNCEAGNGGNSENGQSSSPEHSSMDIEQGEQSAQNMDVEEKDGDKKPKSSDTGISFEHLFRSVSDDCLMEEILDD